MAVLGGLVQASFPIANEIKAHVDKDPNQILKMEPERIVKQQMEGVKVGVKEFRDVLAKSIKQMQPLLR